MRGMSQTYSCKAIHTTDITFQKLLFLLLIAYRMFQKIALRWYSKCYSVASVTKMFTLTGVQTPIVFA
jgi:hypothetical protein